MDKFNEVVSGAISIAQSKAIELQNTELTPYHLMYGLLKNKVSYSSRQLKDYFTQWFTQAKGHSTQQGVDEIRERDLLRFIPQILPDLKIDVSKINIQEGEDEEEVPKFLINLNEIAESGKLDPVIGRTKEIRAVMEILGRRGKNNPVLVGPAGVGKTAIVEGLAEMIVKESVPDVLKSKTVYSLEMGALMAGTKFRGEFEERIQALLKFTKQQAGQIILFIDEIHQLVGAGRTDGAMDAANLLKPALARGELNCIGATTPEEFQKYILNDAALERRFRSVPVNEPTKEDSIEILFGIREKHEMHHGIKISDEAVYAAVMLSEQYITDKNLPDKAIDLVDESASALKLSAEAMPGKLVELESEIRNKRILLQVEKNTELEKEIDSLQASFDSQKLKWEKEVLTLKEVSTLKNQLDRYKFDLEVAEREQKYEEASKLKYSLIPEVQAQLEERSNDWVLNEKDIANVISRQTGIPLEKILKSKQDSLLKLEDVLRSSVYGQDNALHEISETLLTSYAGLTDETRPLGSFLLLGPTGVGKTETAKAITKYLFDNEDNIIRLDLSEFSEKHSVSKLIGAPAGYVGYDDGGVLTEAVRRKPYAVILLDEVEKAHPDFSDILLQILDDGRLTDNKGRTISFKNTIILMTSNSKNPKLDFKPEVLGRLDGVLTFNKLDKEVMVKLVGKQAYLLNERLKSQKIAIEFSPEAIKRIAELGYSEEFGARPLQTTFNRLIARPLSKKVLSGQLSAGRIEVDYVDGKITL